MNTKNIKIEPWVNGIQNIHDSSRTPTSNIVNGTNIDIDIDGVVTPRKGYTFLLADTHSLFEHDNVVYGIHQDRVCIIDEYEARAISDPIVTHDVSWTVLNGDPVFTNSDMLYKVTGYTVTNMQDELDAYNGELAEEALLSGKPVEIECSAMPGGNHIAYWRGHLLVAKGRTLFVSKALHYGIYENDAGVYPFEGKIEFLVSLDNGVYISVRGIGVYFMHGKSPSTWERVLSSTEVAQEGAAIAISSSYFKLDGVQTGPVFAVWFTRFGFTIGVPSGDVIFPQVNSLDELPIGTGSLSYKNGRLTLLSQ